MMPPYKKSNPLAMALGFNESSAEARASLPSPRLMTLYASELPETIRPGDRVCLNAIVKSMDSDGNVTVAFVRVADEPSDDSGRKVYVTPPESPAP